jgi:hypothetical protein
MTRAVKTASLALMLELIAFAAAAQQLRVVDLPVESFETKVAVYRRRIAQWIDDNQLVVTALAQGAQDDAPDKPRLRAVLVNYATRSIDDIEDGSAVLDADADGAYVLVGPDDRRSGARQIAVDSSGRVSELRRFGPNEPLPFSGPDVPKGGISAQQLRRKQDGYLYVEIDVMRELDKRGEPLPTKWARAGKPPMSLPIIFTEILSPNYVRFLGKYLLNDYDSQMSSNTNGALNSPARWKRPYPLPPYRLLSLDGTIEEIPYPKFVFDYKIGKFEEFRITRAGMVLSQVNSVNGNLYFYRGSQLYRLTSTAKVPGMERDLRLSGVQQLTVSPDGCKVAYLHYNVKTFEITDLTPNYLAILDVCKEAK